MGSIGAPEVLVVLVVALLVLGPQRLPDAARQLGRAISELRRVTGGFQAELRDAINDPVASQPAPGAPPRPLGPVAPPPAPAPDRE